MTTAILWFIGAGVILMVAASFLTRAADDIAERSGLGRVWMGAVLLSAATSLPELTVDVAAVRPGAADLAAGDLFGSSVANTLILAVLGLAPPRDEIFRRTSLDLTLSAALAITVTAAAALLIFTQSSTVVAGVSPGVILLLALFVVGSHVVYPQQHAELPDTSPHAHATTATMASHSLRTPALRFVGAAAVILFVAPPFASNA